MSARKSKPPPDDKEQSARFIETAGQVEFSENPEEAFEKALRKVMKTKPIKKKEKISP